MHATVLLCQNEWFSIRCDVVLLRLVSGVMWFWYV